MSDTWRVDDMSITKLVEYQRGERPLGYFFPALAGDAAVPAPAPSDPASVDPATGNLIMSFHSYLVRTLEHVTLIDTGIGVGKTLPMSPSWDGHQDDRWMRSLHDAGHAPKEVDYVICTHLHAGHVGWNTVSSNGRWQPAFPNARYIFVDRELAWAREWLRDHANDDSVVARSRRSAWEQSIQPILDAGLADVVGSTHVVSDHLRLIPAAGHTPGHVAVAAGRGTDHAVFTGDIAYSPLQISMPDLRLAVDADPAQAIETRRAFVARYADTGTLVCTMHFPAPSVGRLRTTADGVGLLYVTPDPYPDPAAQ